MFVLTEEHLLTLWDLCQFRVPTDRWVFFGLRGCLPVNDNDQSFARAHPVKVEDVDYVHARCALGQWQPGRVFALFPGSATSSAATGSTCSTCSRGHRSMRVRRQSVPSRLTERRSTALTRRSGYGPLNGPIGSGSPGTTMW